KRAARQAVGLRVAGRAECLDSVTTDGVVGAISEVRAGVVNPKLGMVEYVENLGTELQSGAFLDLETLGQGHIEVPAGGVVEHVSPGVAEGQSAGRGERSRIPQCRPKALRIVGSERRRAVNVAHNIRK